MSSTKEVVTPLDTNIKYRQYKFPKNPTVIDYVLVVPRNFYFYFKNLSDAFGPKFVLLILLVYGFQQGKVSMCVSKPCLHLDISKFFTCIILISRSRVCMVLPGS